MSISTKICKVTLSKRKDPLNLYQHSAYQKRSFYTTFLTFPLILAVNISSYCNFSCKMCPRVYKVPRRRITGLGDGNMEFELFKKIVDEVLCYKDFIGFIFALYGEPLMNKEIITFIRYIKKMGKKVQIVTNGSLLTKKIMEEIIDARTDKIKISFTGATSKEYKFWRNYDYIKTRDIVLNLLKLRDEKKSNLFIQVGTSISRDSEKQIRKWVDYWDNKVDNVYVDCTALSPEKAKEYNSKYKLTARQERCIDIFTRLSIMHNGKVSRCVQDEENFIGDVNHQTIASIWDSKARTELLKGFLKKGNNLEICKHCYFMPRVLNKK